MSADDSNALDALRTYLDGKMQRYKLLFAVNGGAFAIAKVGQGDHVNLGNLDLGKLAIGAIAFTIVMTIDIWLWGQQMRETYLAKEAQAFSFAGKTILLLLAALQIFAWSLAATFQPVSTGIGIVTLCLGAALAQTIVKRRISHKQRDRI
jgi:ACR3 family arsenite efflux pump ArsB